MKLRKQFALRSGTSKNEQSAISSCLHTMQYHAFSNVRINASGDNACLLGAMMLRSSQHGPRRFDELSSPAPVQRVGSPQPPKMPAGCQVLYGWTYVDNLHCYQLDGDKIGTVFMLGSLFLILIIVHCLPLVPFRHAIDPSPGSQLNGVKCKLRVACPHFLGSKRGHPVY